MKINLRYFFNSIAHTTSESLALCRELNSSRNTTFLPDACTSGVTTERYVCIWRHVASWWNVLINYFFERHFISNRRHFTSLLSREPRKILKQLNSCFQIYPYLVVNDACMTESRREERILQLLRLLNLYLEKRKVRIIWLGMFKSPMPIVAQRKRGCF